MPRTPVTSRVTRACHPDRRDPAFLSAPIFGAPGRAAEGSWRPCHFSVVILSASSARRISTCRAFPSLECGSPAAALTSLPTLQSRQWEPCSRLRSRHSRSFITSAVGAPQISPARQRWEPDFPNNERRRRDTSAAPGVSSAPPPCTSLFSFFPPAAYTTKERLEPIPNSFFPITDD